MASTNADKVLPPMRDGLSKKALRTYAASIQQAWDNGWHIETIGQVKIESSAVTRNTATLVACLRDKTAAFLDKDGKSVDGEDLQGWSRQKADMALRDGRWIITKFAFDGECSEDAAS